MQTLLRRRKEHEWNKQNEVKWRTPGEAPTRDVIKLRRTVLQSSGQGNQAQTPTPSPTHTRKLWLRLWKGVRLIRRAVMHLEPAPASALFCHSFIKVSSCGLSFWLHLSVCVLFSYITAYSTWWNDGLPILLFIWLKFYRTTNPWRLEKYSYLISKNYLAGCHKEICNYFHYICNLYRYWAKTWGG